jgi:hypothetical protein
MDKPVIICRGCGFASESLLSALHHYATINGIGSCGNDGYDVVTKEFFIAEFGQEQLEAAS